jgi:hypothetical protein
MCGTARDDDDTVCARALGHGNCSLQDRLAALATNFNGRRGTVGKECHDAKRIAKLPGTWARLAEESAERPHRLAKLVDVPAEIEIVSVELLKEFAEPERPKQQPRGIFKIRATDAFTEATSTWPASACSASIALPLAFHRFNVGSRFRRRRICWALALKRQYI